MATSELTQTTTVPAGQAERYQPVTGTLDLDTLPGRDLSQSELRQLAATVASKPEAWTSRVDFDAEDRVYTSLKTASFVGGRCPMQRNSVRSRSSRVAGGVRGSARWNNRGPRPE